MSEFTLIHKNIPEYVGIQDTRQGSGNVSYNTQREVSQLVNEYLFRDEYIQNPVKDLR